jgi:hypothetical protein
MKYYILLNRNAASGHAYSIKTEVEEILKTSRVEYKNYVTPSKYVAENTHL